MLYVSFRMLSFVVLLDYNQSHLRNSADLATVLFVLDVDCDRQSSVAVRAFWSRIGPEAH